MSAELLPDDLVTASGCLAPTVPDTWALSWTGDTVESRQDAARRLGLETEAFSELGVRPGVNGLLQTEDEADRVAEYIARPEVGAEPAQWLPWLIIDYTNEVRGAHRS